MLTTCENWMSWEGGVDLVAAVFVEIDPGAAAEADDEAAFAEVVDEGDLLGHAQRVVERGLQHGEADPDARRRHVVGLHRGDRLGLEPDLARRVSISLRRRRGRARRPARDGIRPSTSSRTSRQVFQGLPAGHDGSPGKSASNTK